MIFLTVGTQFPFDRLIKAVDNACDEGLIDEEIFAQTGESTHIPRNFKTVSFLTKNRFDHHLNQSSSIIGHAGMGIISLALDNNKPLLVMPRLKKYKEVVNDHQFDIARKFAELQHILLACDERELPGKICLLKSFVPKKRNPQIHSVAERISLFLNKFSESD